MSIPIWIWAVAGLWIVAIIIAIIYSINFKKSKKECEVLIDEIRSSLAKINKEKITKRFEELDSYKVTNSLNEFISQEIEPQIKNYNTQYQKVNKTFQELVVRFESKKVFKLPVDLEAARQDAKSLQFFTQKLSKNIKKVFDEEKDNREIVDVLKIKLAAFENTYVVDEELFFHENLVLKYNDLVEKYETIDNDNNVDYDYLVDTSKSIYQNIKDLEDKTITYPQIYDDANATFKRLGELNELYEKLISQNYNLDDVNFVTKYDNLVNAMDELTSKLVSLDDCSNLVLTQTNTFIDDCYLRFEDEISAKENLNRNLALYERNSARLEKLIGDYDEEMSAIKKYDISEETIAKIDDVLSNMNVYLDRYYNLVDFISEGKIEYSKANEDFSNVNNNIIKFCEESQTLINFSRQTRKDELNAIDELSNLRKLLNDTLLDSLSWKVNTDSVNQTYIQGKVILKRLEAQLNTSKINIDQVNNILHESINLMSDFKMLVQKELMMKKISQNTLVYANRYRDLNENNIALNMCERLVTQGLFKRAIENVFAIVSKHERVDNINDFIKTWEVRG